MTEYWKRPEATAETLRDGWLYTGDVGFVDDEGYLYIRDRIRDLIVWSGRNVYPPKCWKMCWTNIPLLGSPQSSAYRTLRPGRR